MYGYTKAEVQFDDKVVFVDLTITGNWVARSSDDHSSLCDLLGFEVALSKALESEGGVGQNKKGTVKVIVS